MLTDDPGFTDTLRNPGYAADSYQKNTAIRIKDFSRIWYLFPERFPYHNSTNFGFIRKSGFASAVTGLLINFPRSSLITGCWYNAVY